jgi:hypothetical protein
MEGRRRGSKKKEWEQKYLLLWARKKIFLDWPVLRVVLHPVA